MIDVTYVLTCDSQTTCFTFCPMFLLVFLGKASLSLWYLIRANWKSLKIQLKFNLKTRLQFHLDVDSYHQQWWNVSFGFSVSWLCVILGLKVDGITGCTRPTCINMKPVTQMSDCTFYTVSGPFFAQFASLLWGCCRVFRVSQLPHSPKTCKLVH